MSSPHQELRGKIVNALNLTPLVSPQADTETLNIVNEAWFGLSALMRELMRLEEQRRAMEFQRDLFVEKAALAEAAQRNLEEQLEAARAEIERAKRRVLHEKDHTQFWRNTSIIWTRSSKELQEQLEDALSRLAEMYEHVEKVYPEGVRVDPVFVRTLDLLDAHNWYASNPASRHEPSCGRRDPHDAPRECAVD